MEDWISLQQRSDYIGLDRHQAAALGLFLISWANQGPSGVPFKKRARLYGERHKRLEDLFWWAKVLLIVSVSLQVLSFILRVFYK